jgi:hypothetical protein
VDEEKQGGWGLGQFLIVHAPHIQPIPRWDLEDEQIKWQTANGKSQMVFHLPFAFCHLNFGLL